ncbi:MAG TPA: hypothetical protein DD733_08080, partial [Clostridiales bacterium]|nr:hypothetical protein [Clostridiales bacterium]
GVGTILITGRTHVKGLTTAAGLWTTAAIGLALGIGFYEAAVICTALSVLTIVYLSRFENIVVGKNRNLEVYIEIKDAETVNNVIDRINNPKYRITKTDIRPSRSGMMDSLGLELSMRLSKNIDKKQVLKEIAAIPGVAFAIENQ